MMIPDPAPEAPSRQVLFFPAVLCGVPLAVALKANTVHATFTCIMVRAAALDALLVVECFVYVRNRSE